jgi:signal transduction histidine kinase/ligand-binding sensor domain-containing protein/DNA-binding response OmpR family regulator
VFFVFSQDGIFYHYGVEEGLSQESVQAVIKTKDGFLWIGTQDGLNRYDGIKFTTYKQDRSSKNSISGNFITTLLENKEKIWIGTSNNGVNIYNSTTDNFKAVGPKTGNCTAIAKGFNKTFVGYLKEGLIVFEDKKGIINKKIIPFFAKNKLKITSIQVNNDKELYVGTKSGRLFKTFIYTDTYNFREIPLNILIGRINNIFFDYNLIWLCTENGIFYLDNESMFFSKLNNKFNKKIRANRIKKNEQTYFFATENGLIICDDFDEKHKQFKNYKIYNGDENNLNSITSNRVYDIFIKDNLLWIGTNKLDLLILEPPVFNHINITSNPLISNNHTYSIHKTPNYLFIGTRNGLNCINNKGETFVITKENSEQKLAANIIRSITEINNYLWLGTTKGITIIDLNKFNPKKPKVKSIYSNQKDTTSLSNNNIRNVFIDNQKNIWISTYGGGINLFTGDLDKSKYTFKQFKHLNDLNSISSDYVFNISQDSNNDYWVATKFGLNKMRYSHITNKATFKVYKKNEKDNTKIHSSNILTTYQDLDDIMWIGTQNGFFKLDKKSEIFTSYSKKNGLTNNVIYSVIKDHKNNLWLSTNSGLFRFNKEEKLFTNFKLQDGLQSTEYNLGAYYNDKKNNILYFGGTKGVDFFNPNNISILFKKGNLKFTSLNIKGENIKPNDSTNILKRNITKAKEINLNYQDFPIYLTFSDLNFTPYNNSSFYYKITPNDNKWNIIKKGNEIQLLNLSPGNYKLKVQGKSNQKFWSKKPLELSIFIAPPWYKSNLAYLFYFLLISSFLFYLIKHYVNQKIKQQEIERLKELNTLKTELYTNITHEFRTPITVILGMADNIKEKWVNKLNINDELKLINDNSHKLLKLINQILVLSKLENKKLKLNIEQSDIVSYIQHITESLTSLAREKGIALTFHSENEQIIMGYDSEKINQIICNLIFNAIKFCNQGDEITVCLREINSILKIEIKDTGIGINKKDIQFIFNRFYQAKNNNNTKYNGTGIGLSLTKKLVLLMNGNISVESKINHGTTFFISLPITKNEKNFNKPIVNHIKENTTKQRIYIPKSTNESLPIALIVEDNVDVATYIFSCLKGKYQILFAENGEVGIEKALEHIPDIIISDIMMPKKDGFELCQTIKKDIKTNHIPIILLTAKTAQNNKITGLKLGADAYLTKPFNKEELLIRIQKLIYTRKLIQSKNQDIENLVQINKPENLEEVFLKKVIDEILENIDNSDFNSKKLAENLFLSNSQLYRKVKALTDLSVALFIRKIRLQRAKELLTNKNITISEVCYSTGFNQPSWFSKAFKKEFGVSPREI